MEGKTVHQNKVARIERKYSKKISKLLEKMANNTMEELWVELDKLKKKMEEELIGVDVIEIQ